MTVHICSYHITAHHVVLWYVVLWYVVSSYTTEIVMQHMDSWLLLRLMAQPLRSCCPAAWRPRVVMASRVDRFKILNSYDWLHLPCLQESLEVAWLILETLKFLSSPLPFLLLQYVVLPESTYAFWCCAITTRTSDFFTSAPGRYNKPIELQADHDRGCQEHSVLRL